MSTYEFTQPQPLAPAQAPGQAPDLLDFDALLNSFNNPPSLTNSPFSNVSSSPEQQLITPQMLHSDTNDMLSGFPLFGGGSEQGVDIEALKQSSLQDAQAQGPIDASVLDGFTSLFNTVGAPPPAPASAIHASPDSDKDMFKPSLSPPPSSKSRSSSVQSKRSKVQMSDPIQPRKYTSASATSRKKIPAAFESRVEGGTATKRGRDEVDDAVPVDVQDAIEAKRRQNTLAARKSRERKRNQLADLEAQVEQLMEKNADLTSRIEGVERLEEELRLVRLENESLKRAMQL
ncbi:hypothetical protein E3P99_00599 [Wallemia hederae]|uniref:BZIP domain-containing protein n=1 Tax=Wallemia hederae TaxID=1540922 RepID=A0A4V4LU14_9BASI|nr:hypothetical protein E3P99_00599 [Wallemia hederae]